MLLTDEEFLNCYIIQHEGRTAYLFQSSNDKLTEIKKLFPDLKYTKCQQGILISKLEFIVNYFEDDDDLTDILSFCCPITYDDLSIKYSYDIIVKLKNNKHVNIISYICDKGCCDEHAYNLCIRIKKILKNLEYVDDVIYIKNIHYNEEYYIRLLSEYTRPLTNYELNEINNYMYNLGFSGKFQDYIEYDLQFNNPIHRGILIGLLTQSKCNILQPFLPLDNYPDEEKAVNDEILNWEKFIIESFKLSAK